MHADVCVGTCSQHQWSVSALKAPKRRGATLGARHNAANTHPLSDFLSLSSSRSLPPCRSISLRFHSSLYRRPASSVFANSYPLSSSFHQPTRPKFAKIFEAPSSLFTVVCRRLSKKKNRREFSRHRGNRSRNFYFSSSLASR